jgi:hypothetical protein
VQRRVECREKVSGNRVEVYVGDPKYVDPRGEAGGDGRVRTPHGIGRRATIRARRHEGGKGTEWAGRARVISVNGATVPEGSDRGRYVESACQELREGKPRQ